MSIKIVGKSGQISLGKALAGTGFLVEELPGGDIVLKRAAIVPINERSLHESAMREKLAQADARCAPAKNRGRYISGQGRPVRSQTLHRDHGEAYGKK